MEIILAVYDEIQTLCREDVAEAWKTRLQDVMLNAARQVIHTIPVEVDCGIHDHWKK